MILSVALENPSRKNAQDVAPNPLALHSLFGYFPPAVAKQPHLDLLHHVESRVINPLTEYRVSRKTICHEPFPKIGIGLALKLFMDRIIEPQTNDFENDSFIPALITYEYRGYIIGAWARPELTKDSTSIGVVYKRDKFGSLIRIHRIEGKLFESKEQAEQHGVELCKEWIDKQFRVHDKA
jgi:hypothetical protein